MSAKKPSIRSAINKNFQQMQGQVAIAPSDCRFGPPWPEMVRGTFVKNKSVNYAKVDNEDVRLARRFRSRL